MRYVYPLPDGKNFLVATWQTDLLEYHISGALKRRVTTPYDVPMIGLEMWYQESGARTILVAGNTSYFTPPARVNYIDYDTFAIQKEAIIMVFPSRTIALKIYGNSLLVVSTESLDMWDLPSQKMLRRQSLNFTAYSSTICFGVVGGREVVALTSTSFQLDGIFIFDVQTLAETHKIPIKGLFAIGMIGHSFMVATKNEVALVDSASGTFLNRLGGISSMSWKLAALGEEVVVAGAGHGMRVWQQPFSSKSRVKQADDTSLNNLQFLSAKLLVSRSHAFELWEPVLSLT